jgi:sporulation protein YlmC with PRC-barrel domain
MQQGWSQPGMAQMQPGMMEQPGYGRPGMMQQRGYGQPGMMQQPGYGQPGMMQQHMGRMQQGMQQQGQMGEPTIQISKLRNKQVQSRQQENLGKVEDVVITPQGRAAYLLVARGDRFVPIPWRMGDVQIMQDKIVTNLSRNDFENAPTVSKQQLVRLFQPQFQQQLRAYYSPQSRQQAQGMQNQQLQQQMESFRTSNLIGKEVQNTRGESVGKVKDVVIDQRNRMAYAILDVGQFLGVGEKQVAIPASSLQMTGPGQDTLMSNLNQAQLRQMPEYQAQSQQQQRAGAGQQKRGQQQQGQQQQKQQQGQKQQRQQSGQQQ